MPGKTEQRFQLRYSLNFVYWGGGNGEKKFKTLQEQFVLAKKTPMNQCEALQSFLREATGFSTLVLLHLSPSTSSHRHLAPQLFQSPFRLSGAGGGGGGQRGEKKAAAVVGVRDGDF